MVENKVLITLLRALGFHFKRRGPKTDLWKKRGALDRLSVHRRKRHDLDYVRSLLRSADLSDASVDNCFKIAERHAESLDDLALFICPECNHVFGGNGWDGIDSHWRAKHEHIMPYEKAWPLIRNGNYKKGGSPIDPDKQ